MCPPLLSMLKSDPLTPDKLRLLQRLTCAFDKDMPKVKKHCHYVDIIAIQMFSNCSMCSTLHSMVRDFHNGNIILRFRFAVHLVR